MAKRILMAGAALAFLLLGTGAMLFAQTPAAPAGAVVAGVQTGGPAEKAGIVRGDIILTADNKMVNEPRDLVQALAGHKAGDVVALTISHGDQKRTVSVTLSDNDGRPYVGVMLAAPVAEGNGTLPPAFSAIITAVTPDSPAAKAGLQARDVVLSVDGMALDASHSLADLIAAHKSGDTVTLSIASAGAVAHNVSVMLAPNPSAADKAFLGVRYGVVPSDNQGPRMDGGRMSGGRRGPTSL